MYERGRTFIEFINVIFTYGISIVKLKTFIRDETFLLMKPLASSATEPFSSVQDPPPKSQTGDTK